MITTLSEGIRKAHKAYECYHCQRDIAAGEMHGFQTNKQDSVYTVRWHVDCGELACEYIMLNTGGELDEGMESLRDEWRYNGEYESECDAWRGFYPHVIARMELTDQLSK